MSQQWLSQVTAMILTAMAVTAMTVTEMTVTAMVVTAMTVTALAVTVIAVTAMAVTARWLSQPNGCHINGCHSNGCHSNDGHSNDCHSDDGHSKMTVTARKLRFHVFNFPFLRDVSHGSFASATSTLTFWGQAPTRASFQIFNFHFLGTSHRKASFPHIQLSYSRPSWTKASLWHLQLPVFEGCPAPKLRLAFTSSTFIFWGEETSFRKFNCHFLRGVSYKSFVFTTSTFRFWGTAREITDARKAVLCSAKRASEDEWGRSAAWRLWSDHSRTGPAL